MPIGSPFAETVLTWLPKTTVSWSSSKSQNPKIWKVASSTATPNQAQKELMAAEWLAASSPADGDLKVRFDTISLIVLNEQRAFMRHHTNVFSQA